MHARLTQMSLEKNSLDKELDSTKTQFVTMRKSFEGQLKKYTKVSQSTITRAEDQLTVYNEEWANRLHECRTNHAAQLKQEQQQSELQLLDLQTQFNEAHNFYHNAMEKLKGEIMEEERVRRNIEALFEDLKLDLNREKSARKALTKQLKKERRWRERCMDLTKDVMDLRTEGGGGGRVGGGRGGGN